MDSLPSQTTRESPENQLPSLMNTDFTSLTYVETAPFLRFFLIWFFTSHLNWKTNKNNSFLLFSLFSIHSPHCCYSEPPEVGSVLSLSVTSCSLAHTHRLKSFQCVPTVFNMKFKYLSPLLSSLWLYSQA